jgi:hypothetical protein
MSTTKYTLDAKCRDPKCVHVWTVLHLPMELSKVAEIAARVACPKCGDTKPLVA